MQIIVYNKYIFIENYQLYDFYREVYTMEPIREKSTLIVYDCKNRRFDYMSSAGEQSDSRLLWQIMLENGNASKDTVEQFKNRIIEIANSDTPHADFEEYYLKNKQNVWRWYRVGFICPVPGELISITFTDIDNHDYTKSSFSQETDYDELTGIYNRSAFGRIVESIIKNEEQEVEQGQYALVFFDILRFKAINDIFGVKEGNNVLKYIADAISQSIEEGDVACRLDSDRFAIFAHTSGSRLEQFIEKILGIISEYDLSFKITCNVGIYVTREEKLSVDTMIDRAVMAQSVIKGSYTVKFNYYTEALRNDMLSEQEISGMMTTALEEKHFVVYFQPQYNHATGTLIGAEALVRWLHPSRGMISPGVFIPIFEKNGFITKLDLYVFEQVCSFLRKCMDNGMPVVPVSTNFSRHDIFQPNFVEKLEEIRTQYDIPVRYLPIEITESVIVGGSQNTGEIINKLHKCGYTVEMDDFGSGYSSLNVLKDIDLDIVKLDMMFLSQKTNSNRGGIILSSVVRMAKWLNMPVIAEGVETMEQADFLRSIGCEYIQGYLYSRPLPESEYEELLKSSVIGTATPQMKLIDSLNAFNFWDPKSQETLIFSNYVGGAAIFEYHDKNIEILRVNQKYLKEIGMNLTEKEIVKNDPLAVFDDNNKQLYIDTLESCIETGEEQECETWRTISSECCGDEKICIRSNIRMIGNSDNTYLFYAMIRNITAEKERLINILDSERRFKMASEQANIYYWEYTIATKEMRPCFRCMRDLGLPAVLTNYPDSAIEMGVFPPEVADMYRDWHRQIAEGVPELEAVIPLTVGRIPFRVKYTTEFDENGLPVKAYGSATLIVE